MRAALPGLLALSLAVTRFSSGALPDPTVLWGLTPEGTQMVLDSRRPCPPSAFCHY